jgi:hypothetical protein
MKAGGEATSPAQPSPAPTPTPVPALNADQKATIIRAATELHVARDVSVKKSGGSFNGKGKAKPSPKDNQLLMSWHPVLRTVVPEVADPNKPPPTPPPLPTQLGPWDTGYITFDGGVPVGGSAQLVLYQNGGYSFSGNFHDSGFPSYTDSLVWGVLDSQGTLFTFAHSGEMYGTFQSGSRDDSWNNQGFNPAIAGAWVDLCAGWSWHWEAGVNWDLGPLESLLQNIIKAAQVVVQVISVVSG